MIFNRIHHVAITCKDYAKSKHFYIDVLGLKPLHEVFFEERQFYKLCLGIKDSLDIELFHFINSEVKEAIGEIQGLRHLALEVNSVEETKEYLSLKGILVEEIRVDSTSGKKFVFFKDPDGTSIEAYEK